MATELPRAHHDWSEDEKHELQRLNAICATTERYETECSRTDSGDPWCIVHDRKTGQVLLHIARIERRYAIVDHGATESATIRGAVDIALQKLRAATAAISIL